MGIDKQKFLLQQKVLENIDSRICSLLDFNFKTVMKVYNENRDITLYINHLESCIKDIIKDIRLCQFEIAE